MHRVIHKLIHTSASLIFFFYWAAYPIDAHCVTGVLNDWATNDQTVDVDIRFRQDDLAQSGGDTSGGLVTVIPSNSYSDRENEALPAHADSVTHEFSEVVVTATRQPVETFKSASSVSIISQKMIENSTGSSVGSLVAGIPGLFMRDYGGRNGIQSVSLRGTYSEHTLVLVDGLRYNSFQNSQTDFSLLSASNVERIEVVKGGHSAVYGADAIGGVINIVTRKPSDSTTINAKASVGSSGFSAQEVSGRGMNDKLGWNGLVRRERGNGEYKYRYNDGITSATLTRNGADYDLLFVGTRLDFRLLPTMNTTAGVDFTNADRGSPGAVTSADAVGRARLGDRIVRTHFALDWKTAPLVDLRISTSFIDSRQTYSDQSYIIQGVAFSSEHRNKTLLLNPDLRYAYAENGSVTAGVELSRASIVSTDVIPAVRWQRSAYLGLHHGISLDGFADEVIFYPSVRYDHFSSLQGDVSPKLGINIGLLKTPIVRLRSSYGKNFRVPTFNELHWKVGGNPRLRSERSYNLDLGVVVTGNLLGPLSLDVGVFEIKTNDRIVWTPGAGGIWSPRNIHSVESRGIEAEARWSGFDGIVNLSANSIWNDVRKRSEDYPGDPTKDMLIPYIPGNVLNLSATLTSQPFAFFVRHSWMSYRFTTEMNDRFLSGHSVTDAALTFALPTTFFKTEAKVEATNIFNTSYTIVPLYPMPLREFKLTIGVEL